MKCYSVGYQGKSIVDFCNILVVNSVKTLVDVRARAWSYRPEFRKQALRTALEKHDITYKHCKLAGNPYRPKNGHVIKPELCAANYRQYLNEVPGVIEAVEKLVNENFTALFCYEANRSQCHRGILISFLEERNSKLSCIDL